VHNSFLQQLFDGGLVGWILLALAIYWSCSLLAKRQRDWGNRAVIALVAMAVLLLSGITEVSLAPGAAQDTFWLLLILVGVACQASGTQVGRGYLSGDDATATHELENAWTKTSPTVNA
jgi:O-antigen ligase